LCYILDAGACGSSSSRDRHPQGIAHIAKHVPDIIEDGSNALPKVFRQLVQRLLDHLKVLYRPVAEIDAGIKDSQQSDLCRKHPSNGPRRPSTNPARTCFITRSGSCGAHARANSSQRPDSQIASSAVCVT
jgi:hypothetical protein